MIKNSKKYNILVLGLGLSAYSVALLANSQHHNVTVIDEHSSESLQKKAGNLSNKGICVKLNWQSDSIDSKFDLVIISPGISPKSILGCLAENIKTPVISELEYAFRYCLCPVIAVTGTNGKTTTVRLIEHILKNAGKNVQVGGNIGIPFSELIPKSIFLDYIVLEVSSFQLERVDRFAAFASAIINLSSDHIDRHNTLEEYLSIKFRIFNNQKSNIILNYDLLKSLPSHIPATNITSFASKKNEFVDYFIDNHQIFKKSQGNFKCILNESDIPIKGVHNLENIIVAIALSESVGVSYTDAVLFLQSFSPVAHRQEVVCVDKEIIFVNDSKATNPDSVIKAIKSFAIHEKKNILLIAGGRDKALDLSSLTPYIKENVRHIFLIGEASEKFFNVFHKYVDCIMCSSLELAVNRAIDKALANDVVLLSPACASQDMFVDYKDRGNKFSKEIIRRLRL